MKKSLFAVAALVAAFGSNAATITQSAALNLETTEISQDFTFNLFDSSLGTLTGVSILFDARSTSTGTLTNNAAQTQTFGLLSVENLLLTGSSIDPQNLALELFRLNFPTTLASGATRSLGNVDVSNSLTFSPVSLSGFKGTGTTSFNCISVISNTFTGGGGNLALDQRTQAGCGVSLEYTYTPTTTQVPEPASLALVGLALAGAGFASRRRKA